jgi:hypothetical protein
MAEHGLSAAIRRAAAERAHGVCEYCCSQEEFSVGPFCVDHIVSGSAGGASTLGNLAFACPGCNAHKGAKTVARDPVSGEFVRLFNPRKDAWRDHFSWSSDQCVVVGLTPVGRATVEALQMNRPGVVRLRRVLSAAGEHPPAHLPG